MQQASGRGGMNRRVQSRNLNRRDLGADGTMMFKSVLTEMGVVILITTI